MLEHERQTANPEKDLGQLQDEADTLMQDIYRNDGTSEQVALLNMALSDWDGFYNKDLESQGKLLNAYLEDLNDELQTIKDRSFRGPARCS